MSDDFRALAWGFNPSPDGNAEPAGCVLWFRVASSLHLRVIGELPFTQLAEQQLSEAILKHDRELDVRTVRYMVASPSIFPKPAQSYKGMIGEYVSEQLAHHGTPVISADDDEPNGFARIQSYLRPSPDGPPWLSIDPACLHLVRSLGSAMSDDARYDELAVPLPAVTALRYGVMSRPSPELAHVPVVIPFGSPAYYMQQMRACGQRRFGQIR